jgi:putative peptidoglycan lipid II flippase
VLLWTLVLLCILGVVGAPLMVWALASGLQQTPHAYDAAVLMTRWMFPYIGFMSLVALAAASSTPGRRFAVPAASPVLLNLTLIARSLLARPWFQRLGIEPIYSQCIGVMAGRRAAAGHPGAGPAPHRHAAAHRRGVAGLRRLEATRPRARSCG